MSIPILLSWCPSADPISPCAPNPCKPTPPPSLGDAFFIGAQPPWIGEPQCPLAFNSGTGWVGLGTMVHVTVHFSTYWGIPEDVVGAGGDFSIEGDVAYNNGFFNLPCPEVGIGPVILRDGIWELNVVSHVTAEPTDFGIPIVVYSTYYLNPADNVSYLYGCDAGYYAASDGTRYVEGFYGS